MPAAFESHERAAHVHRHEPLQGEARPGDGLRGGLEEPRHPPDRRAGLQALQPAEGSQARRPHALLLAHRLGLVRRLRSEEHTSELQSLMRISYAVFCLKQITYKNTNETQRRKQWRREDIRI